MIRKIVFFLLSAVSVLRAEMEERVTINGYFSVEFEEKVSGDSHPRVDEYGSFDSDLFDIVINVQATDRLRVAADLTWEHGPQSELGKGNVATEFAFAEYTVNNYLKVRAGKMFTPFGIYNEIHTAKPSTIIVKEPNPTNKIYFISDETYEQTLLYPRWGSGVALLGDAKIGGMPLDYIVQIANGDLSYGVDGNEFDKDDNEEKAVTARVRLDISDDLQVGVSAHSDVMTRYQKTYTMKQRGTGTDSNGDTFPVYEVSKEYLPADTMKVDSQGAQLIWHAGDDFRLELEYVTGSLDVAGVTRFVRSGYSILPSYFITEKTNLYFLYTAGDPNNDNTKDGVVNYAPGVNYEVDQNMFLKAEIFTLRSEENNPLYAGAEYAEFRAALAIGF